MKHAIERLFHQALTDLRYPSVTFSVTRPENPSYGIYATNVAFVVAKEAKENPVSIATKLVEYLMQRKSEIEAKQPGHNMHRRDQRGSDKNDIFSVLLTIKKFDIVKPGYINLIVYESAVIRQINQLLSEDWVGGMGTEKRKEKALLRQGYGGQGEKRKVTKEEEVEVGSGLISQSTKDANKISYSEVLQEEKVRKKRIVIEYTDPNPFKELHAGHVYSNAVGESLSRLLSSAGHTIRRVCYQGDVGLHVGKALWGMIQDIEKTGLRQGYGGQGGKGEESLEMRDDPTSPRLGGATRGTGSERLEVGSGTLEIGPPAGGLEEVKKCIKDLQKKPLEDRVRWMGQAYAAGSKAYEEDEAAKLQINELNLLAFVAAQKMHEKNGWKSKVDYEGLLKTHSHPHPLPRGEGDESHPEATLDVATPSEHGEGDPHPSATFDVAHPLPRREGDELHPAATFTEATPRAAAGGEGWREAIHLLYEAGRAWSLEYFETRYKLLGTTFDGFYFESLVGEIGYELVRKNISQGIFEESDGAVVYRGEKKGLHTRVFINTLGLPTYEAKELGLAPKKYDDWPYDLSYIVTGKEIEEYFKVLISALKDINPKLGNATSHIGHGMVRLPQGKMSSRSGTVVTADDILDKLTNKIKIILDQNISKYSKEEYNSITHAATIAALKYSLLRVSLPSDIVFDLEKSVSLDGDSGPYLLYTYARCKSVLNRAANSQQPTTNEKKVAEGQKEGDKGEGERGKGQDIREIKRLRDQEINTEEKFNNGIWPLRFAHDEQELNAEERLLIRQLFYFPEIVFEASESLSPSSICRYLSDLAQAFNTFYAKHAILKKSKEQRGESKEIRGESLENGNKKLDPGSDISSFRLFLTAAAAHTLKQGLWLLGIPTVERM